MTNVSRSTQLHFSVLTALGGLLLASGDVGWGLPLFAIVSATIAHLVVDRWRWFSIPTWLAYTGMALVAIYCMVDFVFFKNNNQLMAVAQLLVLVQVVMLFQYKTVRVYEQIGVFCLLELIVAAIFNSAIFFGLTLLPFALVGLRALVLLQALTVSEDLKKRIGAAIQVESPHSTVKLGVRAKRLPRYGVAVLTPAVLLVACLFFYGLPRTSSQAAGSGVGGRVTTGFEDSMTLDQVGQLLRNEDLVMRLGLIDRRTGVNYEVRKPIYLRGQILESYSVRYGVGRWESSTERLVEAGTLVPEAFVPSRQTSRILYDDVEVQVELQPLTTTSLFVVAPYHELQKNHRMEHLMGRWLLRRNSIDAPAEKARFGYRFGTYAFSGGVQTPYIRLIGPGELSRLWKFGLRVDETTAKGKSTRLTSPMLTIDRSRFPKLISEAAKLAQTVRQDEMFPYEFARAVERYLAKDGGFQYTLDLTETRDRSVDPIEEFIGDYRKGHCQYFASAMVMMCRSQGIPARIVLGYRTDEFNPMGKHYIVRQSHAHAWVEILVDQESLPISANLISQPEDGPVLVRFDPTPGSSREEQRQAIRVNHFYDFAQTLWNNYVLDMDSERQNEALFGREDGMGISSSYGRLIEQVQDVVETVNSGQLGAGALSGSRLFSWRAAAFGVSIPMVVFGLYRIGFFRWWRFRRPEIGSTEPDGVRTQVHFFQQLCDLLNEHRVVRLKGQTPAEFARHALDKLPQFRDALGEPLGEIITLFYRVRYRGEGNVSSADETLACEKLEAIREILAGGVRRLSADQDA